MKRGLRSRIRETRVTLWTLIVPPTVWAAHFLFSYLWAAILCAKVGAFARFPWAFAIGTLAALAIIAAAGVVAWIQGRAPGDAPPHDNATDSDRVRFLAFATQLLAILSFIAVVFTAVPVIFLTDCR